MILPRGSAKPGRPVILPSGAAKSIIIRVRVIGLRSGALNPGSATPGGGALNPGSATPGRRENYRTK